MHILFEHFTAQPDYLWTRIMAMGSKGEWVHCEIVFDELENLRASAWGESGMEFRQWHNPQPESRFELYPLPSENWKSVYDYCKTMEGSNYDKLGILGMIFRIPINNQNCVFCSELCYKSIQNYTSLELPAEYPSNVSPLNLRRMLINQNIKPVPLSTLNNT